ncbi:MAG: hypothetical protein OXG58_07115 [Gemmatimonadetes bacterium]|nr:hypothetical protein [Gemmatimonadota bacterium]
MSRFSEPLALVPIDDPVGLAWAEYTYNGNPQPLIDLGILSPDEPGEEKEEVDAAEVEAAKPSDTAETVKAVKPEITPSTSALSAARKLHSHRGTK